MRDNNMPVVLQGFEAFEPASGHIGFLSRNSP
jgi:hypothetical protein